MSRKKRKLHDKKMFDIIEWTDPHSTEDINLSEEVKSWMIKNDLCACGIHERDEYYSYTILVDNKTAETLKEAGYIIGNVYGGWFSLFDNTIDLINPITNKKIKLYEPLGSL